jgi:hypothetical protein
MMHTEITINIAPNCMIVKIYLMINNNLLSLFNVLRHAHFGWHLFATALRQLCDLRRGLEILRTLFPSGLTPPQNQPFLTAIDVAAIGRASCVT